MTVRPMQPGNRPQQGFTYLAILLALALLGVGLAAIGTLWSTTVQRDRETELLYVGEAYRSAIASYYRHGARLPITLEELVEDRRGPIPLRHLRRLYVDPMTGRPDWTLVQAADGGILGVRSSSQRAPIKRANFSPLEADFADRDCYCDWAFTFNLSRQRSAPTTR